ncbi:MAG: UDP-N-acetylglucosamine diphosphorylase/glucosamine-1-phosphate N-acetyltransferase [Candidatus Meridianibacter frigidus]|nr:MAG: UDP-N-acetylglucosamine diphosphorylase/glucosamine-1-phosphate N-acetyltransferase [Candidatus Eremiobacteraeota bacterium]
MNVRAIVLAAGKGTRMKSARPKVLHELCGRPMLWYTLRALRDAGVVDIAVVGNAELKQCLNEFGVRGIVQEPQLGTGHAVQVALRELPAWAGRVLIAYGDMPLVDDGIFSRILATFDARPGVALAMVTARMPLPSNFGRVIRSGDNVRAIVEERDCDESQKSIDEMNAGVYLYDESALRGAVEKLNSINAQSEYYLTDTVASLANSGKCVIPVDAGDYRNVLGINDRVELAQARKELNARLCAAHMREGVTIVDPERTYLEPELLIGRDTVIYPNTSIGRLSQIGEGCVLGPGARLSNAKLAERVIVRESVITDSRVGAESRIGPFAHLRNNATLAAEVKIGNFVEVKNSRLDRGVKANHLAYLGDATVGENSNIGAGTITCNYDGQQKNETIIGRDVMIGSNTSLVAPLRIGDGALTGASSVVTKDVAPGERVAGNPARPLPEKGSVTAAD